MIMKSDQTYEYASLTELSLLHFSDTELTDNSDELSTQRSSHHCSG